MSGYTPARGCDEDGDSKVRAWNSVDTTHCCLNALDTLSQGLAKRPIGPSIFLTREEWAGCDLAFQPQRGVNISACSFGDLYSGSSSCSSLGFAAILTNFVDQYDAAVQDCSQLKSPDFDDQCAGCIRGITGMKEAFIEQLQVEKNGTEEMVCGVAAVVAVAASGIKDSTWVRDLYSCLDATSTDGKKINHENTVT